MKMSPFETLYARRCRNLGSSDNLVNIIVLGLEMLQEIEQEVAQIMKNLKVAQDNYKIYVDWYRVHKELHVGDHVYF